MANEGPTLQRVRTLIATSMDDAQANFDLEHMFMPEFTNEERLRYVLRLIAALQGIAEELANEVDNLRTAR